MSSPGTAENGPRASGPRIFIYTLGRLELVIDGQPLRFAGRAPLRPLELLTAVIAGGGRGVGVPALCDLLWPEADAFDAYRALTVTLHRLRRLLRIDAAIRLSAGRLSLEPGLCQVDLWQLQRSLRTARDAPSFEQALSYYHGPFLADDASPWALATRAALEQLLARARNALASYAGGRAVSPETIRLEVDLASLESPPRARPGGAGPGVPVTAKLLREHTG